MPVFDLRLTSKAEQALKARTAPLRVVMELYFSCLLRKRVLFSETPVEGGIELPETHHNLSLIFHPVVSRVCTVEENPDGPPLETMPIKSPEKFMPKWLRLDFSGGKWRGEFGYD